MRLERLQERLRDIPHSSPETGAVLYRTVLERGYRSCLELGFAHGVGTCYIAGALEEGAAGKVTALDLPGAERRRPRAEELLAELGLSDRAELVVSPSSYTWYLMGLLERQERKIDFCFLDGSHEWETDGLAVLLLERLLTPGGMILMDDLDWTFAGSPSLHDTARVRTMPEQERITPQVRKVFELLLVGNPAFSEVYEQGGLGFAVKA